MFQNPGAAGKAIGEGWKSWTRKPFSWEWLYCQD